MESEVPIAGTLKINKLNLQYNFLTCLLTFKKLVFSHLHMKMFYDFTRRTKTILILMFRLLIYCFAVWKKKIHHIFSSIVLYVKNVLRIYFFRHSQFQPLSCCWCNLLFLHFPKATTIIIFAYFKAFSYSGCVKVLWSCVQSETLGERY